MARTRGFALLLLTSALLVPACGDDPPEKELQQAQSAIDSARAAGANDYAHDELAGAELALKNARDAIGQRDYRQALTSALDSRERAQTAASQAGEQKVVARTESQRLLTATTAALTQIKSRFKATDSLRGAPRVPPPPRGEVDAIDRSVQEARAAIERGEFAAAIKALTDANARLAEATRDFETPAAAAPHRRR